MNDILKEKLAGLPDSPGVYIMKDRTGAIIYVGKAVVLKNRVRQYFFHTQKQVKVQAMVDNVADFEYIMTLSERDALALEANLIKKHKPRYNILLKDDKASPYIRIDLKEQYPTVEVTRKVRRDGAKYFGPYFNGIGVWDVVGIIRSAYRMRTCPKKFKKGARECLNYHIDLCLAPCCGHVTPEEYREVVERVMAFLSGRDDTPAKLIEQKMIEAAKKEEFERAIYYRDRLDMLSRMKERTLADLGTVTDIDAFNYVTNGALSAISVTVVRAGKLMGVRNYMVTDVALSAEEAIASFVLQYYGALNVEVPEEICFPVHTDVAALEEYLYSLSRIKTEITFPQRGTRKKLIDMALKNARDYLEKNADKEKRKHDNTVGAAALLAEILQLDGIRRMECYDISNISGVDKVASQVVFINGEASNADYRRFKIKTVEGSNDFASMAEVIRRRFARLRDGDEKFDELPDLIVIDGGKGQLSAAYTAMRGEGYDVPMVGLAKREEEIFTVFDERPIVLPRDNVALKLLQRIRDEAHRFAITYHRSLRAKRYYSELESIRGVGAAKREKLLKVFKYNEIKTATVEQLAEVVDRTTAENVFAFYHKTID
ncbi:MAG: excinuclease ABC subunit UvrC [Clostridia bacterium]|nr:excinuclease ABC subunit UvrC [Clostridia bacterium]